MQLSEMKIFRTKSQEFMVYNYSQSLESLRISFDKKKKKIFLRFFKKGIFGIDHSRFIPLFFFRSLQR